MSRPGRGRNIQRPFGANPSSAFHEETDDIQVHPTLLKNARSSGHLNIAGRNLTTVPKSVLNINIEQCPDARNFTLDGNNERWWDQTDLTKLIMANNCMKTLPDDIRLLHALQVLDIHDNSLERLPDTIGMLLDLQKLELSRNQLTTLPSSIKELTNLTVLRLDINQISDLPDEIGDLVSLEDLDVSKNCLVTLPPTFGNLMKLRNLNLSSNQLTTLPPEVGKMAQLKVLDLQNNQINTLPPDIGNLRNLDLLYLQKNKLISLPILENCKSLKELHLGYNLINELNDEHLAPLSQISMLDLRDNKLTEVPQEITLLVKLQRLDLTNNSLQNLPNEIGLMENLRHLQFDGNPIRNIRRDIMRRGTTELMKFLRSRIQEPPSNNVTESPVRSKSKMSAAAAAVPAVVEDINSIQPHDVCHFKTLTYSNKQTSAILPDHVWEFAVNNGVNTVNLGKNCYTTLPSQMLKLAESLTEIHMGFNKLTTLPPEIGKYTKLLYLDIRNNCLSDLPEELSKIVNLREINLSHNQFPVIPSVVYELQKLEILFVNGNRIEEVDVERLQHMPLLSTLNLQNNNIVHVPPELALIPKLVCLQLEGNPFRTPRPAIIAKGSSAVIDYLRDRIVK